MRAGSARQIRAVRFVIYRVRHPGFKLLSEMLMDVNDIAIIESLLEANRKQITGELSGQYNLIKNDLSHIKEQTTKTNGRVTKLEGQMQNVLLQEASHDQNCPVLSRVEILEKSELRKQSIYKFLIWFGSALVALLAGVVSFVEIAKHFNPKI